MTHETHRPTLADARRLYALPLTTLILRAQEVHHRHHNPTEVMLCSLKSIKTGACPEDCSYCPQSSRNHTFVEAEALMETEAILGDARRAKAGGSVRFCMGAAWRSVRDGRQFDSVLDTVRGVKALGMQVCCTLGMLTPAQALRLKEAGCDVYNHNLDTSRDYYPTIITTRTYDDRLDTLASVRAAGLQVCSGGILGMGESVDDRLKMLVELANLDPQPDSVPINALVAVEGTPLEGRPFVDSIEFVRTIATARILMPRAVVRLSAGRTKMSDETQALCFLAGASSIFTGEKLLTTGNPGLDRDLALLGRLGLHPAGEVGTGEGADAPDHEHPLKSDGTWAHGCTGDGHCSEAAVGAAG
ncbi:biotin synthase [mine drainage metagenome]|uniref:biotin synthase n=1 Tax=mine drainage metagenome TaxID=410659 RepID=A0A1J5SCW7_9ZZZZ